MAAGHDASTSTASDKSGRSNVAASCTVKGDTFVVEKPRAWIARLGGAWTIPNLAEGEGFEPPVPFPVQWFSRPSKGGRGTSPSQFTPIKQGFPAHDLGAGWGLSAPGHGQKADSGCVVADGGDFIFRTEGRVTALRKAAEERSSQSFP